MGNTTDKNSRAEKEFEKGIELLDKEEYVQAGERFKDAHSLDPKNAKYLSYYGLATALSEKNPRVGIELCLRALKVDDTSAEFYLNLGKVYAKVKNRNKAMETFKIGMKHDKNNKEIITAYEKIGKRKNPAITFLSRDNIVNIYLGRLKSFLIKL